MIDILWNHMEVEAKQEKTYLVFISEFFHLSEDADGKMTRKKLEWKEYEILNDWRNLSNLETETYHHDVWKWITISNLCQTLIT